MKNTRGESDFVISNARATIDQCYTNCDFQNFGKLFTFFASSKEKNMYMKIKGRPMKMKKALDNPSEAPTVLPGVLLVWNTI